jgi:hypothetical protein
MLGPIRKTLLPMNCYHECVHNAEVKRGNDPFTETCLKQHGSFLPKSHSENKRKVKIFWFGGKNVYVWGVWGRGLCVLYQNSILVGNHRDGPPSVTIKTVIIVFEEVRGITSELRPINIWGG